MTFGNGWKEIIYNSDLILKLDDISSLKMSEGKNGLAYKTTNVSVSQRQMTPY